MKTFILALIVILGMTTATFASKSDTLTLRSGQQKSAVRGDLRVKFISVLEDSRCPPESACVWAGNAKIKVKVTDRRGRTKMMEINTNAGPKGDQFGGYAVNLTSLTQPKQKGTPGTTRYTATFSVERLYR